MSSPAPPPASGKPKHLEQISFRFCSECSNMLYPKEDEDSHKLQFTCRTCQYTEEATSSCIYRNILSNAAGETAGVTQDVSSDPTVGSHSVSCPVTPAFCLSCSKIFICDACNKPLVPVYPAAPAEHSQDRSSPDAVETSHSLDGILDSIYDCGMAADSGLDDFEYLGHDISLEAEDAALGLPRSNQTCPACNHSEAVFFQSQQRSAETGMKLFYVCCECGNIFQ